MSKSLHSSASPVPPEKLPELLAILATVGLDDPDHWGFQNHLQNPETYADGHGLEWSERGKNMRYLFHARPGKPIHQAQVYILDGRSTHDNYSQELIAEANRKLSELFQPLN